PGGSGFISGIVGNGAGKNSEVGNPISGLSLVLMNENMEAVSQTLTDMQGKFSFDNLEKANFSIWVDKSGINNNIAPLISLSTENSKEDLQFILHENYLEYKNTVTIKKISDSDFNIFPNPTNGQVFIQSDNVEFSFELYNILGEKLIAENNLKRNTVLDLTKNQLTKGTYILKVSNKKGNYYSKLVYRQLSSMGLSSSL
ncbi:MAG: T9SS type A sorting domain-containing protein, partial [Polaribacter sp.]